MLAYMSLPAAYATTLPTHIYFIIFLDFLIERQDVIYKLRSKEIYNSLVKIHNIDTRFIKFMLSERHKLDAVSNQYNYRQRRF